MTAPTLWPHQEAALRDVSMARESGLNRLLVKMPTGTGKTVFFAAMLKWPALDTWLGTLGPGRGGQMLVIAHREELLDQAAERIQRANPGIMVSIEQGDRRANSYSQVVIASIQTLSARKFHRLHRLLARHTFRIVIVDEAHHAAAASYRTALAHLGFLPTAVSSETGDVEAATFDDVKRLEQALAGWDERAPTDRLLIGVTATPNRTDAIGLGCVFQTIAYNYGLKQAIDDGFLVPPIPWEINTSEDLDRVRVTAGEFNQKDLADAVNNARRNRLAVDAWQLYAGASPGFAHARPTIAFTVDVAHAHDLAAMFTADGVRCRPVSGETPKDERREILRSFREGRLDVITNCMVLTEGTDLPMTSCILHAKPTKSATLYEQMTGRGLRIAPGKTDCIVLDVVDIARRHSLQTAPVLYGLPPGLKTKGEDLRKTAEELEALREKTPGFDVDGALATGRFTVRELLDRAATFDVWSIPALGALGDGLELNWVKVGQETYRLQYPWGDGLEVIQVQPDVLGHYDVSLTMRSGARGVPPRQRTVAAQIASVGAALGLAEAFVKQERRTVTRLKGKEAAWRAKGATSAQLLYAKKLGVSFPKRPLTAGEVSDLIDLAKGRLGR